jgi:hypothetical protein
LHLCVYSIAVLFFFSPDLQPQLSTLLGQLQCVVRVSIQTRFWDTLGLGQWPAGWCRRGTRHSGFRHCFLFIVTQGCLTEEQVVTSSKNLNYGPLRPSSSCGSLGK